MGGFLRLSILLLFITDLSAQIITFNKIYKDTAFGYGKSIIQTPDGGYLTSSEYIVYKLDEYGNIQWKRSISRFGGYYQPWSDIETDNTAYYILNSDSGRGIVNKFDQSGNLLWRKNYGKDVNETAYSIVRSGDDFIICGSTRDQIIIHKMNSSGDIIAEKRLSHTSMIRLTRMKLLNDNSIGILRGKVFYKLSENLDSLNSISLQSNYNSFAPCDSGIMLAGNKLLTYLDAGLDSLRGRNLTASYYDIYGLTDGSFILAGEDVKRIARNGNEIWTVNKGTFYNVHKCKDNGFVFTGRFNYGDLKLLKLDSNGICKWIDISYTSTIPAGKPLKLRWSDENIKLIDIEFSSDQGKNWSYIADNAPDSGRYLWNVPEQIIEKAMLKLTDADNPLISDLTTFNIGYNLTQDYIAVNQIKMWMNNAGEGSHDFIADGSGLYWPGGEGAEVAAIYTDGLVWGGYLNGELKVNGSTYRTGLRPGKILENGKAGDPKNLEYNLWRLKKDWQSLPESVERNRYEYNYNNWPAQNGAPYEDVNRDGEFSRETDIPKLYGDETFWFVANDLDTSVSKYLYGSNPMGMEMQCTVYGYNRTDELGDVIFKKYKLINKSGHKIEKLCAGYWSDPDLGFASDDYVGCDTTLDFGFVYNSDNKDEGYYGENPPAAGYLLLDSPPMTGFIFYLGGSAKFSDPTLGQYDGSAQLYNYLNSKLWDGKDVIDPYNSQAAQFWLPGDPVAGVGWYQGEGWPGGENDGDKRLMLRTGPYDVSAGDTVEVTVAIILARGSDNINSVKVLKDKAKAIRNYYYHGVLNEMKTYKEFNLNYSLEQNYPNPFNPVTTIRYSLPEKAVVEIAVYDILGKKVTTLVNEEKPAGEYRVLFNANNLASGVYYYRLKTNEYLSTRKMVLIR